MNHIHSGEILLVYGYSPTVQLFLQSAAAKKRQFSVLVCEAAPEYSGVQMAEALTDSEHSIHVTVITDAAVFAVMNRVNKVLLAAHAVLANGGLVTTQSGANAVALAARHCGVPVICTTGLYTLSPKFPHDGVDTLNELLSPDKIVSYEKVQQMGWGDVELVNPRHDLIKPEHIDMFITNVGSFQPSFIYRLLAEYYHADDWNCFD